MALDIAKDGALDSVTVLVTAVESATVIALDGVIVATEDRATVLLVSVTWTADETMTVGLLESVTVPEEICMALEIAKDGALDRITVKLEDGVTVTAEVGVTESADEITVEAVMADDKVTVLAPAVVERPTIQEPI